MKAAPSSPVRRRESQGPPRAEMSSHGERLCAGDARAAHRHFGRGGAGDGLSGICGAGGRIRAAPLHRGVWRLLVALPVSRRAVGRARQGASRISRRGHVFAGLICMVAAACSKHNSSVTPVFIRLAFLPRLSLLCAAITRRGELPLGLHSSRRPLTLVRPFSLP